MDVLSPIWLGSYEKNFDRLYGRRPAHLVHYTSVSTLLKIIDTEVVWMRNARLMNDFWEMTYAFDLVRSYFSLEEKSNRFEKACDACFEGVYSDLNRLIFGHMPSIINDAYITCLSEHRRSEIDGRLSMWRGYGGRDVTVAIYLHTQSLLGEGPYGLSGYNVEYWTLKQFTAELDRRVAHIEKSVEQIKLSGREKFVDALFQMFQIFAVAIKHPGFAEEREWRLV